MYPRIFLLHFKETDIAVSISGRKNIPSGCYPTTFDPTKVKNSTGARSKRLDTRKRRCAEQPKAIKDKALRFPRTNSLEKEFKTRISYLDQNLSTEDIQKLRLSQYSQRSNFRKESLPFNRNAMQRR